jgi:hypothetical protein
MANLATAQLMEPPEDGGPAFVGAVKQGTGIILDAPTGTINADLNTFCSKIVAGSDIQILPASGIGTVTISSTIKIDPNSYLPIGTLMTFFQTGAPPRWITESPGTRMLRINSSGGSQGGSLDWNSVFTTQTFSGSVSTSGASISGSTDTVNETPSGSVTLNGLSLGDTSISTGQLPAHTHTYRQRDNTDNNKGGQCCVAPPSNTETTATGGNGGHSHSLSGSGSFNGNNMSHSHSVSGSLSGSGSFSGGSFDFNPQYIDMIVCRKLTNPA